MRIRSAVAIVSIAPSTSDRADPPRRLLHVDVVGGHGLLERRLVEREQRRGLEAVGLGRGAVVVAVLLARRLLQLGEALEAERLREPHDRRGRRAGAARELLGGVEGDLVEMVDDVLGDVLLRARELVEARRDVGGKCLVAAGGRGHRGSPRHGGASFDGRLVTSCPAYDSPRRTRPAHARPSTATSAASSWRPTAPTRGRPRACRPSSSRTTTRARAAAPCAGCTSRPRPARASSSAWPAAGCSTWWSTSAATPPPSGSGRPSSSTTSAAQQLWIPVGFAHGFCVLSDVADFVYKVHELLRPGDRVRLQLRRPRRRHRVAGRRADLLRARPRRAAAGRDCRLTPVLTAASRRARPARCTSATCARRCSRGCSRARPARASSCAWRTSTPAACGRATPSSSSPTSPPSASTGTARSCTSRSGSTLYADGDRRARRPRLRVLLHAGRDPRGGVRPARPAARGRLSRHLPAADRGRAGGEARERPRAGAADPRRRRPDRVRGPAARPRRGRGRRLRRPPQRRRARLQPGGGGRRRRPGHRRGRARRRPARHHAAPALPGPTRSACPRPVYAHVPLVLGPDGARLAKRHGAVTLREVDPTAARAWMLRTLGLSEGGTFDPGCVAARADGV